MSARTGLTNSSVKTAKSNRVQSVVDEANRGIDELKADLKKFLHENGNQALADGLDKVEQKGLKREYIGYGLAALLGVYLLFGAGYGAALVCNFFIGAIYPVVASLNAVRNQDSSQDTRLLTYWSLFGAMLLLDSILSELPGYYLLKAAALLALELPQLHGSEIVYARVIEPALNSLDSLSKKAD